MYVPEHFAENDLDVQLAVIRHNNFGTLVSIMDGEPVASHIPCLIDDQGLELIGHVARANPQWRTLSEANSLVIFQGPHAYVSPTWYRSPGVPTWNYIVVHVVGRATLIEDHDALHDIVSALSDYHESANPERWDGQYPESMLRGIVGFRIAVDRIEGKRKMSQNRSLADRAGVVDAMARPFGTPPDENQCATRSTMKSMLEER